MTTNDSRITVYTRAGDDQEQFVIVVDRIDGIRTGPAGLVSFGRTEGGTFVVLKSFPLGNISRVDGHVTASGADLGEYLGMGRYHSAGGYPARYHSADDLNDEAVTAPVAVYIRPDGSVDVFGYAEVIDQRGGAS